MRHRSRCSAEPRLPRRRGSCSASTGQAARLPAAHSAAPAAPSASAARRPTTASYPSTPFPPSLAGRGRRRGHSPPSTAHVGSTVSGGDPARSVASGGMAFLFKKKKTPSELAAALARDLAAFSTHATDEKAVEKLKADVAKRVNQMRDVVYGEVRRRATRAALPARRENCGSVRGPRGLRRRACKSPSPADARRVRSPLPALGPRRAAAGGQGGQGQQRARPRQQLVARRPHRRPCRHRGARARIRGGRRARAGPLCDPR